MHETLIPSIKGYVDFVKVSTVTSCRGWLLDMDSSLVLRAKYGDVYPPIVPETRRDVDTHYKTTDKAQGWTVTIPNNKTLEIQVFLRDEWQTVLVVTKEVNATLSTPKPPSCVILDNVYESPDDVRAFALTCNFKEHSAYHKGRRTDECYRFDGLKERFEQVLGRKIINWEKYGTNGCFQYCIGGDQLVYHNDTQQYAGVLYLTPNAPVASGTNLYRARNTGSMVGKDADYHKTYPTGHLDPAPFEIVDVVGNVYNRVILFNSHLIHAASSYFGDSKENGRLFQLFFFDFE